MIRSPISYLVLAATLAACAPTRPAMAQVTTPPAAPVKEWELSPKGEKTSPQKKELWKGLFVVELPMRSYNAPKVAFVWEDPKTGDYQAHEVAQQVEKPGRLIFPAPPNPYYIMGVQVVPTEKWWDVKVVFFNSTCSAYYSVVKIDHLECVGGICGSKYIATPEIDHFTGDCSELREDARVLMPAAP